MSAQDQTKPFPGAEKAVLQLMIDDHATNVQPYLFKMPRTMPLEAKSHKSIRMKDKYFESNLPTLSDKRSIKHAAQSTLLLSHNDLATFHRKLGTSGPRGCHSPRSCGEWRIRRRPEYMSWFGRYLVAADLHKRYHWTSRGMFRD